MATGKVTDELRIRRRKVSFNEMNISNHKVYTSCRELVGVDYRDGCCFESYDKMSDKGRLWVNETMTDLMLSRTIYELRMDKVLSTSNFDFHKQVFFSVFGHFYFLDFFIPQLMIAIELDGCSHDGKKNEDAERDRLFSMIGIKTLRYTNRKSDSKSIKSILNRDVRKALGIADADVSIGGESKKAKDKEKDNVTFVKITKEDKETYNHYAIRVLTEAIEGIEDGSKVLIDTKQTYLVDTLDNVNIEKADWMKSNRDMIQRFYDVAKSKNIMWKVRYVGENNHLRNLKSNKCRIYPLDYKMMLRTHQGDGVDIQKLK